MAAVAVSLTKLLAAHAMTRTAATATMSMECPLQEDFVVDEAKTMGVSARGEGSTATV